MKLLYAAHCYEWPYCERVTDPLKTRGLGLKGVEEIVAVLKDGGTVDIVVRISPQEVRGSWKDLDRASGGFCWSAPCVNVIGMEVPNLSWNCKENQRGLGHLPPGIWRIRINEGVHGACADVFPLELDAT